jgi:hypothetical protein
MPTYFRNRSFNARIQQEVDDEGSSDVTRIVRFRRYPDRLCQDDSNGSTILKDVRQDTEDERCPIRVEKVFIGLSILKYLCCSFPTR